VANQESNLLIGEPTDLRQGHHYAVARKEEEEPATT